jgi:hypothetical protein
MELRSRVAGLQICLRLTAPVLALAFFVGSASAGVPYVTDDPDTPDPGHYEINVAAQYNHHQGETVGALPSVEVNYGALDGLELHVLVLNGFERTQGSRTNFGFSDVELGAKYRFIDADDWGWRPGVAFAPSVNLPAGDARRGLGSGHVDALLPIWISEEFKQWTVFGGGGYAINPGLEQRNWWLAALGVTREIIPELTIGAEIFHNTASEREGHDGTGVNVGAVYDISEHHHLLFSVGRNIQNAAEQNQFSTYIGYQLTF